MSWSKEAFTRDEWDEIWRRSSLIARLRERAETAERERDEARQLAEAEFAERVHLDKQRLAERALADRLAERLREMHSTYCHCPGAESGCPDAAALAEHAAARKASE